MFIDRNLLFSNHISSASKKAGRWVQSILMRMHNMISMKVKLRIIFLLYKAAILPNHNYNKIVKSDWLSTALISALIGQFNSTVRIMPK